MVKWQLLALTALFLLLASCSDSSVAPSKLLQAPEGLRLLDFESRGLHIQDDGSQDQISRCRWERDPIQRTVSTAFQNRPAAPT